MPNLDLTDLDLIVFLPLVGAVLGAVVGGFVGAYANRRARDKEAKKADDREREGLMMLIGAEIAGHQKAFKDAYQRMGLPDRDALSTEVWDESKVSLARLLSTNRMTAVTLYYAEVVKVRNQAARDRDFARHNPGLMESEIRNAWQIGDIILDITKEHVRDSDFHADMGEDRYDLFESSEEAERT